jgi:uncharacterized protein YggT (Ycf19 family)
VLDQRFAGEMALIDLILNLVALLLWWNWLAKHFNPLARTSAASLVGTLRKADTAAPRRWRALASLVALIVFRAIAYWEFGASFHWTPVLQLEVINIPFRSDYLTRMMLFSLLSFILTLGVFYFWMILLSVANASVPDTDPLQKLVRAQIKWLEPWPNFMKLLLPFFIGALFWLTLHPLLSHMMNEKIKSAAQLFEQAAVIGAATYLSWKYLIVGILLLHLLNSYVYFGNHPFWNFVNATARNFLHPLRWIPLRVGKVDILPLIAVALIFFFTEFLTNPPEHPVWFLEEAQEITALRQAELET